MTEASRPNVSRNLLLFFGSNTARTVLLMVVGFILTPLQIAAFGLVLFGLFQLINQLSMAMTAPLRSAVTRTLVKAIFEAKGKDGERGVERQFTCCVAIVLSMAGLLVTLAAIGLIFLPDLMNFPEWATNAVRLAFGSQAIVFAATVGTSPWLSLYLVRHRPLAFNTDLTVMRTIDLVAFLVAIGAAEGASEVFGIFIVGRMVLVVAHCMLRLVFTRNQVQGARFRFRSINRDTIKQLAHVGSLTMSQPVGNVSFFFLDSYLLNIVFGPVYNAIYGIVSQLRGYARRVGSNGFAGMEATVADMHEQGGHETNIRAMLAVSRITSGVMILSTGIVAIFFGPLIDLWLGSRLRNDEALLAVMPYQEALDLAWGMLALLLVGGILLEVAGAGARFLFGMGHVKRYAGIMYAAGGVKFLLSISIMIGVFVYFGDKTPESRAVLLFPAATLLVQLVFFGVVFPRRLVQLTGVGGGTYLWQAFGRPAAAAAIPLAVAGFMVLYIQTWTWPLLVAMLCVVGAVAAPCCLGILMQRDERRRILGMIRR